MMIAFALPRGRSFACAMVAAACLVAACGAASSRQSREPLAHTRADVAYASGADMTEPASPLGIDWVFIEVDGYDGPLPSPPPIAGFILTDEGRRVTGTTACNRIGAGYDLHLETGRLRFTKLRNTRMLCDRVAADTEEAVLQAMIATDSYRMSGGLLELISKGRVVARLKAGNP